MSPAEKLVHALETMTAISERQSFALERSRERADQVRQRFLDRFKESSSGSDSIGDYLGRVEEINESMADSRLRESAILDAFRALMLLYKEPECRSVADEVYSCLHQIRMIDVGDPSTDLEFPSPIIPKIDPDHSVEERRKLVMDAFAGQDEQLYASLESRNANLDAQIARSDELLAKALATAKQLI